MTVKNYRDLVVWQKSMQLVKLVYQLVKMLPREETFALSNQMRRAAVSIPSNIAEGYDRNSRKEYVHFLNIARGSNSELRTQLQICVEIGYLTEEDVCNAIKTAEEVSKMISVITKKLSPDPCALTPEP